MGRRGRCHTGMWGCPNRVRQERKWWELVAWHQWWKGTLRRRRNVLQNNAIVGVVNGVVRRLHVVNNNPMVHVMEVLKVAAASGPVRWSLARCGCVTQHGMVAGLQKKEGSQQRKEVQACAKYGRRGRTLTGSQNRSPTIVVGKGRLQWTCRSPGSYKWAEPRQTASRVAAGGRAAYGSRQLSRWSHPVQQPWQVRLQQVGQ